jgi:hypothetical protein
MRGHLGQTFSAASGAPVRAIADGEVVLRRTDPSPGVRSGLGNVVVVRHAPLEGLPFYSLYAHLGRMDVSEGAHLKAGQVLGLVGQSGWVSGPHLHVQTFTTLNSPQVSDTGFSGQSFDSASYSFHGETYYNPARFFGTQAGESPSMHLRVSGTDGIGLRLRSGPGLANGVIRIMPEGAVVEVLSQETLWMDGFEWMHVSLNGQDGWAALTYLTPHDPGDDESLAVPSSVVLIDSNGQSPVSTGETLSGTRAFFQARLPGTIQGSKRLEVETHHLESGQNRTASGRFVGGGSTSRVEVSGLKRGEHTWRIRALDLSGRASPWISFGDEDHPAFVVLAGEGPEAIIRVMPGPNPSLGEMVTFDASQSTGTGENAVYLWEFGESDTYEGVSTQRSFDLLGRVPVKLTVTDAQGRYSTQETELVVLSHDLVQAVDDLVDEALSTIDRLSDRMYELAGEVEFWDQRQDNAKWRIIRSGLFDAVTLGLNKMVPALQIDFPAPEGLVSENLDELLLFFSMESLKIGGKQLSEDLAGLMQGSTPSAHGYAGGFLNTALPVLEAHRQHILNTRDSVLSDMADLSPAQQTAAVQEINRRRIGVIGLGTAFQQQSHFPLTYGALYREDAGSASWILAQLTNKIGFSSLEMALDLSTGSLAGRGLWLANRATGAGAEIKSIGFEGELLANAILCLWDGLAHSGQIRNGVVASLEQLQSGQILEPAAGSLEVFDGGEGQLRYLGTRFEVTSAWSDVRITNTGDSPARFWVYALYQDHFDTVRLPYAGFSLSRRYSFNIMAELRDIELQPGEHRFVRFQFLKDGKGLNPVDQNIQYALFAEKNDGIYMLRTTNRRFAWPGGTAPQGVQRAGEPQEEGDEVVSFVTPLFVELQSSSGSSDYRMTLGLRNPFEVQAPMELSVHLGNAWDLVNVNGATASLSDGVLSVSTDLAPGETRFLEMELLLGDNQAAAVPYTRLELWHSLLEEWMVFERAEQDFELYFPDEALRQAVRDTLGVEEITMENLATLETLDFTGHIVTSLAGLEHARNLKHLDLSDSLVASLRPLLNLRHLQSLSLRDNRVYNLAPLSVAVEAGAFVEDGWIDLRGNPLDLSADGSNNSSIVHAFWGNDITVLTAHDGVFQAWREMHFPPALLLDQELSGPLAQPHDQSSNLIRYAFGRGPFESVSPMSFGEGRSLEVLRHANRQDLVMTIERSADLTAWEPVAVAQGTGVFQTVPGKPFQLQDDPVDESPEWHRLLLWPDENNAETRHFFRVRVGLSEN